MSLLSQAKVLGDWLKEEFAPPNYCRGTLTVLVPAALPSGAVLGTESVFSKYAAYDNSNPAAAAAILIEAQAVEDAKTVTNIIDAANVSTINFPADHGIVVGDIIAISGCTTDADLNANQIVLSVPTPTSLTCASASVTDTTYTDTTLRVTKISRPAACLVRGPALVNKDNLDYGTSDTSGKSAAVTDLAALQIIARSGV